MDRTALIKSQNRLVVQLLWIASVLVFLNNLLSVRDPIAGAIILFACGGLALIMSYVVYTNRMIYTAKYLALAGIHLTVFVFIEFTPGLLSYLAIYIGLFILGIYQEEKLIAMAGALSVGVSTYAFFFHQELIFHDRYHNLWSMVSLNFFIVLACCLLILQAQFGYRVHRDFGRDENQ